MKPLSPFRKILSLLLKLTIIYCAVKGVWMSANAQNDAFMGGKTVFMYFTIQSNLAVAALCAAGLLLEFGKQAAPGWWFVVKYVGTVAITITGMVFCFVLAPTMGRAAWGAVNVMTHVIVPLASILDFFVVCPRGAIRNRHVGFALLPELAYVIYASIGYARGWEFARGVCYPYFFLNWGSPAGAFGFSRELPFLGCVWWIVLLAALVLGLGKLYQLLVRQKPGKK